MAAKKLTKRQRSNRAKAAAMRRWYGMTANVETGEMFAATENGAVKLANKLPAT